MAWNAWKIKGAPSPIHREGVLMDWRERTEGLLPKGEWLEARSRLNIGGHVWLLSGLDCTLNHFVLVHSIDLEHTRDFVWPAMDFAFCQFGKILILHMGSDFAFWDVLAIKLTSICTTIPYAMCLGTVGIKFN